MDHDDVFLIIIFWGFRGYGQCLFKMTTRKFGILYWNFLHFCSTEIVRNCRWCIKLSKMGKFPEKGGEVVIKKTKTFVAGFLSYWGLDLLMKTRGANIFPGMDGIPQLPSYKPLSSENSFSPPPYPLLPLLFFVWKQARKARRCYNSKSETINDSLTHWLTHWLTEWQG